MKHLGDFINEEKIEYKLPEDFRDNAEKSLNELVKVLPLYPCKHKRISLPGKLPYQSGEFHIYDKYEVQNYMIESPKYKGGFMSLEIDLDEGNNNIDLQCIYNSFKDIFDPTIKESVFGNNINKDIPEQVWVSKLYTSLSDFFGSKNFSSVNFGLFRHFDLGKKPDAVFKQARQCPTVKTNNVIVSLYQIDMFDNFKDLFDSIKLICLVYIEKY